MSVEQQEPVTAPRGWPPLTRAFLGAEASGAFAATLSALPQALSLGVLAFAVLGPAYAPVGVAAALLASVVANLLGAAIPAVQCQVFGPRSSTTALLAAFVGSLVLLPELHRDGSLDTRAVLALAFAAVALSGLVQLAFGLLRFGRAVKYVPYPVVAGFMNGVAIIIVLVQLRPMLGLPGPAPFFQTAAELGAARWGAVATALSALAAVLAATRWRLRVPPLAAGLLAGIVVHNAIAIAAPSAVGDVIGPIPPLLPSWDQLRNLVAAGAAVPAATWIHQVLPSAFLIALVGAVDGLLAAVVCDGVTRGRHHSDRVLVAQGITNLAGGLMGGLPAQLNAQTPVANFRAGGRTRLATLLHALILAAAVVALAPLAAGVPLAALAGLMLFIAASLVDRWSSDLVRRLRDATRNRAEVAVTVGIVAAVAIAQVATNLMVALAIGITASVALLLVKLSGSPVRRALDNAVRTSHKVRSDAAREALRRMADRIRILELQGEIFFGTADHLQADVEGFAGGARFVILDFRRVHQIDASGARVLEVIGHRATARGTAVVLAHVAPDSARGQYLAALGLPSSIPIERWFADLDRALEWAEDQLLAQERFAEGDEEVPLGRMALLQDLAEGEVARVGAALERIELAHGDPVFREGDEGDRLYLIARGAVSIKMRLHAEARARRLATFTPGVTVGEMALIEGKRRSADAYAKGQRVVLYALTAASFEELVREDPHLGARIHRNLGRELASRLRTTSEALRALE